MDGVVPAEARPRLIAVARGLAPPDLVITGARVFCAFTREWLPGDVAVAAWRIWWSGTWQGGARGGAEGRLLARGFVEAAVQRESASVAPTEFARPFWPLGTAGAGGVP